MKKNCQKCGNEYILKSGKGSAKAKYCKPCKKISRVEQSQKGEQKRYEKENPMGTSGNVFFYGYKEPLKKFDEGFGFKGVVSYNKERDRVQCHFCGRMFKNVGSHSAIRHGIPAEQYKDKLELSQNTALVGEGTREKMIKAHSEIPSYSTHGKTRKQLIKHMKKMNKKGQIVIKKGRRTGWSLEVRNKQGVCPDQLIDKLNKLADKLGETPSAKQYVEEYGSYASIITVYGTWNKALEIAGMTTYNAERSEKTDPKYLIKCMQLFFERFGRTPRTSDSKRGLIPAYQTYWKVFGNMNNARIQAGIPALIPVGNHYEEVTIKK